MSNINFEDDYQRSYDSYGIAPKGMVGWMVDKKIVPNKKVAEIVLMIVAIVCFGLTFYVIKSNFSSPSAGNTDFERPGFDGVEFEGAEFDGTEAPGRFQ